jgi:hypothetical protein
MKQALKFSVGCLIGVMAMHTLFCLGQDAVWLQLNCHSTTQTKGLQPKHTVVISSVRPVVKQLRSNRWEISFIP